jgi:hypothetical protein
MRPRVLAIVLKFTTSELTARRVWNDDLLVSWRAEVRREQSHLDDFADVFADLDPVTEP